MGSRALITPQNTFVENVTKRLQGQECSFVIGSARISDYPILFASESFYNMTGYERSEVGQRSSTLDFMWDEANEPGLRQRLLDSLAHREGFQAEIRMRCKNRAPLWLSYKAFPVSNENNVVIMFLCVLHDITSQKQPIRDDDGGGGGGGGLSRLARLVKQAASARKEMGAASYSRMISGGSEQHSTTISVVPSPPPSAYRFPPYRPEAPKAAPDILLHYSPFKSAWDWLILLLTVYTSVAAPLFFAFKFNTLNELPLNIANSVVDVVFFVDLVLNFRTTFGGGSGDVITDPGIIRMAYLRTWFAVDLLSCLPYDIFNAFLYADGTPSSSALNALKLLRLLRLGRVARKLDHYIEYGAALLLLVLGLFILFGHWFACIWYVIGTSEVARFRYNWLNALANLTGVSYTFDNGTATGGPSMASAYVTALYFTLSCMTSVGFGNVSSTTDLEKAFACCMMILGALLYASIFGNVTAIMQQFVASSSKYRDLLRDVKQFVKLYRIPRELSERIADYVVSLWVVTKGIDHSQILDHCPKDMRADVSVHLHRKVLKQHPGFRLASDGCLRALALQFNIVHCAPGDQLYHQGESVDQLFFVVSGSLEVLQDDEVVAILGVGDSFGDDFWNHDGVAQSSANVRAMTYCSVHSIKRDKLLQVLDFYPAFYSTFKRNMAVSYPLRRRFDFQKLSDVVAEQKELNKASGDEGQAAPKGAKSQLVRKFLTKLAKSVVNLQDADLIAGPAGGEGGPPAGSGAHSTREQDSLEAASSSRAPLRTRDVAAVAPAAAGAGAGTATRDDGRSAADGSDRSPAAPPQPTGRKCLTAAELLPFRQVIQKELDQLFAKLTSIERHVVSFGGQPDDRPPSPPSVRQSTVSTAHVLLETDDDADRRSSLAGGGAPDDVFATPSAPPQHQTPAVRQHAASRAPTAYALLEDGREADRRASAGGSGRRSAELGGSGGGRGAAVDRKSPKRASPLGKMSSTVHPAPSPPGGLLSTDDGASRGGSGGSNGDGESNWLQMSSFAVAQGDPSPSAIKWRETDLDLI